MRDLRGGRSRRNDIIDNQRPPATQAVRNRERIAQVLPALRRIQSGWSPRRSRPHDIRRYSHAASLVQGPAQHKRLVETAS
jgi:hypothetical protein